MACTAVSLAPMAAERQAGRVGVAVPPLLGELTPQTHFHLVGNGQMVKELKGGLLGGGVAEERVTTETYFNGKEEADADVVDHVAAAVRRLLEAGAVKV